MAIFNHGGRIVRALSTGTLVLGMAACEEPPSAPQKRTLQVVPSTDLKREQDRVAALVDAAAPERSAPMMNWDGYPALQSGSELTLSQLQQQVQALAKALRAQADSNPADVERVLGIRLPPDAKGERRGVTGKAGQGTYEWAVWKGATNLPGYRVELTLAPDACLDYRTLKTQMEASGFRVYVPTFGDDQRITFDKIVSPSLGLYIAATPDRLHAPTCVKVVSFEMERSDA